MSATTTIIGIPRVEAVAPQHEPVDLQPASTYEAITRQMVLSLAEDVKEIKSRTNTIFYMVIGGIIVDMLSRWVGA